MREIRFRAWDESLKKYVFDREDEGFNPTVRYFISLIGIVTKVWNNYVRSNPPIVLEQYTGLNDKNGEPIFEGDIVRITSRFRKRMHTGEIRYDKGRFLMDGLWFTHYDSPNDFTEEGADSLEVIGNIHEGAKEDKPKKQGK